MLPCVNVMNILIELAKKGSKKISVNDAYSSADYNFKWNCPADSNEIEKFEEETNCKLPEYYKEFLLCSNGGVIFNSDYEDDGYELLGIEEIKSYTEELNEAGYDIPKGCFIFMRCSFCDDFLLFDTAKQPHCILDGDVGYPAEEWKYLKCDFNKFFVRFIQCNGAMFWRW